MQLLSQDLRLVFLSFFSGMSYLTHFLSRLEGLSVLRGATWFFFFCPFEIVLVLSGDLPDLPGWLSVLFGGLSCLKLYFVWKIVSLHV